jgi:hypothetical protein
LSSGIRVGRWARRLGAAAASSVVISGLSLSAISQPASAAENVSTIARSSWAYIDSRQPTTGYLNPSGDAPVGMLHADQGGNHVYRSFFTFDIGRYLGRRIDAVTLFAPETEATDCTHRSVELWTTGPVTAQTTWNQPPAEHQKMSTW